MYIKYHCIAFMDGEYRIQNSRGVGRCLLLDMDLVVLKKFTRNNRPLMYKMIILYSSALLH